MFSRVKANKVKIIYLTPDVWYLSEGGITATDRMLKDLEEGIFQK